MFFLVCFFFFKQKTAYEMRISDWSSDVCSSDLVEDRFYRTDDRISRQGAMTAASTSPARACSMRPRPARSEEHTSELQSLMRISYAVFCLKKKKLYLH